MDEQRQSALDFAQKAMLAFGEDQADFEASLAGTLWADHPAVQSALAVILKDAAAIETLTAERDAALARVAVLEPYLKHDGLCGIVGGYGHCTCGLDAARKALEASYD